MIPLYTGKRDIYSFFDFYETQESSIGLSQNEIKQIKNAYPNHELPAQYLHFLQKAGKHFEPWQGSDYCIFDSNGYYDLANTIKRSSYLTELFKEKGCDFENHCVFFGHQGYAFAILPLNEGENPVLKFIDADYDSSDEEDDEEDPITFAEFIIEEYNEHAKICNRRESPWKDVKFFGGWYTDIQARCSYFDNDEPFLVYRDFDYYTVQQNKKNPSNFVGLLASILFVCMEKREDYIYVCMGNENEGYWYRPHLDKTFETPDFVNVYENRAFFFAEQDVDDFGWVENEGKIYIWGEKFRKLIEAQAEYFGLIKEGSGEKAERRIKQKIK